MHHRPSSVALFSHSQRLFLTSDEAPARQHTMSCIAALRRADNHLAADSAPTRRHRPMVHPEHHSPPSFSLFSHSQRWWSLISDEAPALQEHTHHSTSSTAAAAAAPAPGRLDRHQERALRQRRRLGRVLLCPADPAAAIPTEEQRHNAIPAPR